MKFLRSKKFGTLLMAIFFVVLLVGGGFLFAKPNPTTIDDDNGDFPEITIKIVNGLDDDDDDDTDDDDDDDTDDDDDDENETQEEALEEIEDVEEELAEAREEALEMLNDGEITQSAYDTVSNKLDAAENNLDVAKDQYDKGHYSQAEKKADDCEDKIEDAMDWLDDHKTKGENTDDDVEEITDPTDDIINDDETNEDLIGESPEEERKERSLKITVEINEQDAISSTQRNPVVIEEETVKVKIKIENTGNVEWTMTKIIIRTSTSGIEVNKYEMDSAFSLPAGGEMEFETEVERGFVGDLLGLLDSPVYKSHVRLVMDSGDWDYEFSIFWRVV